MRRRIGQRYELFGAMASGGTATVHLGRLHGTGGFVKPIAVKRLHAHLAKEPALRTILVDEARLVARISHPNVVAVLDIVEDLGELFLILEYVHGATLAELLGAGGRCDPAIAVLVMRDVLTGLHAAHHARDANGALLGLVHRDVSPRNVIVTTDGIGKILDFGIAKARARQSTTGEGQVRGSLPYMAPEQLRDETLDARTDVYGASVVLWEALTGRRLFEGQTEAAVITKILDHDVHAPSILMPDLPRALDAAILRGLARDPAQRFASGLEMALALEESLRPARPAVVAAWIVAKAQHQLESRQVRLDGAEIPEESEPAFVTATVTTRRPESDEARTRFDVRARGVIVGGFVILALIAVRLWGGSPAPHNLDLAISTAPASLTAPPAPTPSAPAPAVLPPTVIASAVTPAVAIATPAVAIARPAVAMATPAVAMATPAPLSPPSARPSDCPPYFVDDAGIRRFNRECLK